MQTKPLHIGDRVQFDGDEQIYLVVEINEEAQTCSLIPESEVETAPFSALTPTDIKSAP